MLKNIMYGSVIVLSITASISIIVLTSRTVLNTSVAVSQTQSNPSVYASDSVNAEFIPYSNGTRVVIRTEAGHRNELTIERYIEGDFSNAVKFVRHFVDKDKDKMNGF